MSSCHTAHCLLSQPPLMSGVETLTVPSTVCSPALWSSLIKWLLPLEQALFCWREAIALLGEERELWKPEGCQDTACLSQAGSFSHNDWQWRQVHSNRKLWDLLGNSGSFLKDCVAQHNEMCPSDDAALHVLTRINTSRASQCCAPRYRMTSD